MSLAKITLHPSVNGDALVQIMRETGLVAVQSNRVKGGIILITEEDALIRQAVKLAMRNRK